MDGVTALRQPTLDVPLHTHANIRFQISGPWALIQRRLGQGFWLDAGNPNTGATPLGHGPRFS